MFYLRVCLNTSFGQIDGVGNLRKKKQVKEKHSDELAAHLTAPLKLLRWNPVYNILITT